MKFEAFAFLLASSHHVMAMPTLELRAAKWNDQYIKQPSNFAVNKVKPCTYQMTFQRDSYDSRYTLGFSVQHGSSSRSINPTKGGSLAVSPAAQNLPPFKYDLGNGFDLAVHQFENACSTSGEEPSSFRVLFDLDESGYTYRNDWLSDKIPPSGNTLPTVPQSISSTKASNGDISIRWQPVSGATGYFILVDGRVYASELGSDVVSLSTVRADASSTSAIVKKARRAVGVAVSARGQTGSVSDTSQVREVFP